MPIMYSFSILSNNGEGLCFLVTGSSYQLLMAISGQVFKHDFSLDLNYVCWENSVCVWTLVKKLPWNSSYASALLCTDLSGELGLYSDAF